MIEFPQEQEAEEQVTTVTEDGLIVDQWGEILGRVEPEPEAITAEYAEWILERIQRRDIKALLIEREMASLENEIAEMEAAALIELRKTPEYAQASARCERLRLLDHKAGREKQTIRDRFAHVLDEFSQKELDGKKTRSWESLKGFGVIKRRKVPTSVKILDMAAAVAAAKYCSIPVKVEETVTATVLKKELGEDALQRIVESGAIAITEEHETVTIETVGK